MVSIIAIENAVEQITRKRFVGPSTGGWPKIMHPPLTVHSIGWISPDNTIYDVENLTHDRWAKEAIDQKLPGAEGIEQTDFKSTELLMASGWIRFGYHGVEKGGKKVGMSFYAALDTTNREAVIRVKEVLRSVPVEPGTIYIDDYQTGTHFIGSPRPWLVGGRMRPQSIVQRFHEGIKDSDIHKIKPYEIEPMHSGWMSPDGAVYDIAFLDHAEAFGVITNQEDKYQGDQWMPYSVYEQGWVRWYLMRTTITSMILQYAQAGEWNAKELVRWNKGKIHQVNSEKILPSEFFDHWAGTPQDFLGESLTEATSPEDIRVLSVDEITPTTLGWINREGKLYVTDEGTKYYSIGASHYTIAVALRLMGLLGERPDDSVPGMVEAGWIRVQGGRTKLAGAYQHARVGKTLYVQCLYPLISKMAEWLRPAAHRFDTVVVQIGDTPKSFEGSMEDFVERGLGGLRQTVGESLIEIWQGYMAAWWRDGQVHTGVEHGSVAIDEFLDVDEDTDREVAIDMAFSQGWTRLDYEITPQVLNVDAPEGTVPKQRAIDIAFDFERQTNRQVKIVAQDVWKGVTSSRQEIIVRESLIEQVSPHISAWWRGGIIYTGRDHGVVALKYLVDIGDIGGIKDQDEAGDEACEMAFALGWIRLNYLVGKRELGVEVPSQEEPVSEQQAINIAFDFENETGHAVKIVAQSVWRGGKRTKQEIIVRESLIEQVEQSHQVDISDEFARLLSDFSSRRDAQACLTKQGALNNCGVISARFARFARQRGFTVRIRSMPPDLTIPLLSGLEWDWSKMHPKWAEAIKRTGKSLSEIPHTVTEVRDYVIVDWSFRQFHEDALVPLVYHSPTESEEDIWIGYDEPITKGGRFRYR